MRIVLMGTGPFAGPSFEELINSSDYEVVALFTRPDPPNRKGRKPPPPNPMRQLAEQFNIEVHAPDSINTAEAVEQLASFSPDVLVVCDYGQILKPAALATARYGGINLHGSLLPKYRGAAPVHWAIWEGDEVTGVTVIHMTPRLDGGPCLTRVETPIGPEETTEELEPRLAELGVEPVMQALEMLADWDGESEIGQRQDPGLSTKAPRLTKQDGLLDWTQAADRVQRQFRALQPWPGVYTIIPHPKQPIRLIVRQLAVAKSDEEDGEDTGAGELGEVILNNGKILRIATADGAIDILRVQPAGKREMDTAEFLRGHTVPVGTNLGT